MFRLDCCNDYSKRKLFYHNLSDKYLVLWSPVWIFFVIIFTEVTSDHSHKQRETRRVVTARVVNKGGWCTAGEIDSYLDENEAWCLWGEEGSFSIQMSRSFLRKKRLLNNERKITLISWDLTVENGIKCKTCSFVKFFTLKLCCKTILWNIFQTVGIDTAALGGIRVSTCHIEVKQNSCLYWWIWKFCSST